MIRSSSSRLLKKTGSVANIGKVGSKFHFSLEFEKVDKLLGPQEVVITWERRGKILCTHPVQVDRSTREASFAGQKLEQTVTLFKPRKGAIAFNEKVYQLAVRANSSKGKLVGRIDINFAEYVQIPQFSKRVGAELSSGGQVIMRVNSKYLGEAKTKKTSSRGSSSVSSSTVGGAMDDAPSETDDDLADLGVPDEFTEAPVETPTRSASRRGGGGVMPERSASRKGAAAGMPERSASRKGTAAPPERSASRRRQATRQPSINARDPSPLSASGSSRADPRRAAPIVPTVSAMDESVKERVRPTKVSEEGSTRNAPSRAEFERVKRENRSLNRRVDDLETQNEELQERLGGAGGGTVDMVEDLQYENDKLRKQVRELDEKLRREPVFKDVVRQLKEAKMALAILTLEKDERAGAGRR